MSKLNLKTIFSSPLVVFSGIRRFKLNGFVGGLMFGAIFSLFVNVITVQIQELVNKQRALEAVESEIMINLLQANSIIRQNNDKVDNDVSINYLHSSPLYSLDVWSQSEPLRYIAQLDQDVQSNVILYYNVIAKNANMSVGRANNLLEQDLPECYSNNYIFKKDDVKCLMLEEEVYAFENLAADLMSEYSDKVLDNFHPTQDRLNSFLLKLLMGNKSTRILSGE